MPLPIIRGSLRGICFLGCALAAFLLVACGDPKPAEHVVARIDGHAITLPELGHWTEIEAVLAYETVPKKPVPAGVIPDPPSYAKCIAYLRTVEVLGQSPTRRTPTQLKHQCEARREQLLRHVLDILITYYWLRGEAAERGLKVSPAEIEQVRTRIFPNEALYRRYLTLTGEAPADERLIIEKDLLDTKLLRLTEAKSRPTTTHQREQMLIRAATSFTSKWKARTSCSASYVVAECKQYKGPPSLVAP
jgi:hypothetical protein